MCIACLCFCIRGVASSHPVVHFDGVDDKVNCEHSQKFTLVAACQVQLFYESSGYVVFFCCAVDYSASGADAGGVLEII